MLADQGRLLQSTATGHAESFLSKAAESVPVLGAAYNKAVAKLEGISPFFSSRHLERGVGEYQPRTPEEALKEQQALMEQRAQEHPTDTTLGKVAGNIAGYSALPASSMATLPAAMLSTGGVSALDTATRGGDVGETAGSFVGGATGGALGYGAGKVLNKALGAWADRNTMKAIGETTGRGRGDLKAVLKPLNLKPGELTQLMREQGIVGGFKSLSKSAAAADAAGSEAGATFGNIVNQAHQTGSLIPLDEAATALGQASKYGTRPNQLKGAVKEAVTELEDLAGNSGYLTHPQLQEFLTSHRPEANAIELAVKRNLVVSPEQRAFLNTYNAGRTLQDAKLNEALPGAGDTAKELRRLMAIDKTIHRVAENRANVTEASHGVGLLGTLGAVAGYHQIMAGDLLTGVPVLAASLLAKTTKPYRTNVLISALSRGAQPVANSVLPTLAGAGYGSKLGAKRAKAYEEQMKNVDDFGPPEPAPEVAQKGP